MKSQLTGSHPDTYDAVGRHPAVDHPLWRDSRSMFRSLAELVQKPDGNPKAPQSGETWQPVEEAASAAGGPFACAPASGELDHST